MNIVRVLEIAIVVMGVILFLTQITIPLYRGRPMFPMFRKEAKLLHELEELQQEVVERALERQITKEREDLHQSTEKEPRK